MVCVVPLLGKESILADITRQPSFEARSVTLGVLMGSIKSYFVVTRGSWRFHVPGCSVPSTTCRMDATSSKRLQLSRYVLQGQVPHLVCCLNCDSGMLACGSCWLCLKHGQSHACFEHELNGKPTMESQPCALAPCFATRPCLPWRFIHGRQLWLYLLPAETPRPPPGQDAGRVLGSVPCLDLAPN